MLTGLLLAILALAVGILAQLWREDVEDRRAYRPRHAAAFDSPTVELPLIGEHP